MIRVLLAVCSLRARFRTALYQDESDKYYIENLQDDTKSQFTLDLYSPNTTLSQNLSKNHKITLKIPGKASDQKLKFKKNTDRDSFSFKETKNAFYIQNLPYSQTEKNQIGFGLPQQDCSNLMDIVQTFEVKLSEHVIILNGFESVEDSYDWQVVDSKHWAVQIQEIKLNEKEVHSDKHSFSLSLNYPYISLPVEAIQGVIKQLSIQKVPCLMNDYLQCEGDIEDKILNFYSKDGSFSLRMKDLVKKTRENLIIFDIKICEKGCKLGTKFFKQFDVVFQSDDPKLGFKQIYKEKIKNTNTNFYLLSAFFFLFFYVYYYLPIGRIVHLVKKKFNRQQNLECVQMSQHHMEDAQNEWKIDNILESLED